jgi:hypothetical protein
METTRKYSNVSITYIITTFSPTHASLRSLGFMKIKNYPFNYPVANTEEGPGITWSNWDANLTFTTYQGQKCSFIFKGVHHLHIATESEYDPRIFPYDSVVEVIESEVLKKLFKQGEITEEEYEVSKHIVFGFNEISSYLSIVFSEIIDQTPA